LSRLDRRARTVVTIAMTALLMSGAPTATVRAQTAPDQSDVVLVLDFSASILEDKTNRNSFSEALVRIADRVEETSAELVAGDTTVTFVRFAAKAADYGGCTDLKLLGNPAAVAKFAGCLRSVAAAYRKGLDPKLTRRIGIDTNYVAAMQQAAKHLPADAVRPAMILFTDGRHDVRGVPASRVPVARDQLFGSRSPFALLPVGMGLDPTKRAALEKGLLGLRIVAGMPPCVTGNVFDWPQVVFESPAEAGTAVAVALQNATCTFTVEEAPPPPPVVGVVQGIRALARDGAIDLSWVAPPANSAPVIDYKARCRTGEGDWIEAKEGVSVETKATVDGLTNGVSYQCEVAAIGSTSEGAWTPATGAVMPIGRPGAPAKPSVEALDRGLKISLAQDPPGDVSGYLFQCSDDGGATWDQEVDIGTSNMTAQLGNLTNGVRYVCRAYATNATGLSEASPVSDSVMPCGSVLECNSLLQPLLVVLGVVLAGGLLIVFVALYRERSRRGYVVAVVDVVHSANLGHGSRVGFEFVRDPISKRVIGIYPDRGKKPEVRVRILRGDRFEVVDMAGKRVTESGEPVVAVDPAGGRHQLVLQAFETHAAAEVESRRG
jgi:hypothetical protein